MKEKFTVRVEKFLKKVLDVPPTLEELQAAFPHKANCSMSAVLVQLEEKIFVHGEQSGFGYFPGGYESRKLLECNECRTKVRYAE